jgi:hypothetical protein
METDISTLHKQDILILRRQAENLLFSTYGTPARLTSNVAAVFAPCTT